MRQLDHLPDLFERLRGQTAIITGSARGIGAATATLFNNHGANVVITDLPVLEGSAKSVINGMRYPSNAIFVPASVIEWGQMVNVFKQGIQTYGRIDIVVANAGIMESSPILDVQVDANGDPLESVEAVRVLDVNLKGTLNSKKAICESSGTLHNS